jgi:zinc transporter ZupT
MIDLFLSQVSDPFRIGLVAALLYTTFRNAAVTGFAIPLAAGMFFVAYIIALMTPVASQSMWTMLAAGIAANLVLAVVIAGIWQAVIRFRK